MKGRDFMKKTQLKNSLLLLLTATIWGVAFVAQSVGMDHVGPFTFNAVRSIIGGIVLIPCIFFLDHRKSAQKEELPSPQQQAEQTGTLILGGVCCGILLALASSFQQMGIQYTTVGRAGFITACYIVIVPILGHFFLRKNAAPPSGSLLHLHWQDCICFASQTVFPLEKGICWSWYVPCCFPYIFW